MRRDELSELHYIAPISNALSIMQRGIVSHINATAIEHESVAMDEIQERREGIRVPQGRPLHEYVNLFIDARNPMMYKRRNLYREICVFRVETDVLDLPQVVVADRNASTDIVRFAAAPEGLSIIDKDMAFAESWWAPGDEIRNKRRGQLRSAEVLVPERVPVEYISGIYVALNESRDKLSEILAESASTIQVSVNSFLFFR